MILAGQHLVVLGAGFDPERRLDFLGVRHILELENVVLVVDGDGSQRNLKSVTLTYVESVRLSSSLATRAFSFCLSAVLK